MASVSWVRRPFSLPHSPIATFWPVHRYPWFSPQTKEKEKEGNIVICYNVELKSIRICAANNLKFDRVLLHFLEKKATNLCGRKLSSTRRENSVESLHWMLNNASKHQQDRNHQKHLDLHVFNCLSLFHKSVTKPAAPRLCTVTI